MKKGSISFISILAIMLFLAGSASAHVTVSPGVSAPGAWETYTIKVPVEKDISTTKVTLKIPKDVELVSYQPVPGWDTTQEKDDTGKITTITWSAKDDGITAGQFQQFYFVAKNPEKETSTAWDAFQYYKDGTIVEWTGEEGTDSPHSITKITSTTSKQDGKSSHENTQDHSVANEVTEESTEASANTIQLTLSILSLILSVAAIFISLKKKK